MRFITRSIIALFSVLCVFSVAQAGQYFIVESSLAKIYKDLDPKSPLVAQVQKGASLELIYEGTSWNKVKYEGQEGWIERRAGKIVDKEGGVPVVLIVILVLVAAGVIGGIFYMQKGRTPSMVEVDEV